MHRTTTVAVACAATLLAAAPAAAFHHVGVPGSTCGEGPWAGGNNPTARAALLAHNPAQDLPLPPVGTPSRAVDAPAAETCAGAD